MGVLIGAIYEGELRIDHGLDASHNHVRILWLTVVDFYLPAGRLRPVSISDTGIRNNQFRRERDPI